jgi:ABC-type enterochelin transport system permease subunit
MVKKDSFGAAFAFGEILSVIRRVGWGIYIIWLLVLFVCSIIVGAIGSIPFIGWILAAVIGPLFGVFMARSASLTYMEGASSEAGKSAIEKPEEPGSPEAPK